ncbi:MAG: non-hydrolyzing UDP-N-acetylglucosamine 2-epimerase [Sulfobacillus sp.]
MMSVKMAAVFGTRPEAIKLAPLGQILAHLPNVAYIGINTGQHSSLMPSVMERFGVPTAYHLDLLAPGQALVELQTRILLETTRILVSESPDLVIVQGDTATAVMTAWAAFHCGIPLAHVEAGLRTHRPLTPFPEETYRRTISTFSRWNFAPSAQAAHNLRRESAPGKIYITGNSVVDALHQILRWSPDSTPTFPKQKLHRVVATIHRRENHPYLSNIFKALNTLAAYENIELFFPLHPNPVVFSTALEAFSQGPVTLIEPMDYEDWIHFLRTADLIISDSGGLQEEAPILGIPLLIAREETERPEVVRSGYGYLVGHDYRRIVAMAIDSLSGQLRFHKGSPYGDGHASERIAYHLMREIHLEK